ncbi:glycosyltransferase [Ignatzschineria larvae DSM 13226]|uniref:Glycosyltransferase n=1 Tax=Ignatzschineria larvae DSM 13226 TaxID=1111732 RepID=A0ABZ3BZC1_9GAMM|nr:glycosyltransferase [Ignatzschineria larvae]
MREKPIRIGILLRNRHDGSGGLEKVLESVVANLKDDSVTLYFYAFFAPIYQDFTRSFEKLTVLKLPKPLNWLETHLPSHWGRLVRKIYIKFKGDHLFDQMQADNIDLLIVLDLSKQFLGLYPFIQRFKKKSQIPVISWVHSSLSSNREKTAKKVKSRINILDGHLAISKGLATEISQVYQGKNVQVVFNPVASAALVERDPSKFLYVGRIDENKRVHSLLQQFVTLSGDWRLDIYGSTGSLQGDQDFVREIDQLQLQSHIHFHGWQTDVWPQVKSAGVILLNSEKEGLPLVLIEAMMRGIPALSSDCPTGPADIIQQGQNGWLYPVNEEDRIAKYVQAILDGTLELPTPTAVQQSVQQFEINHYMTGFIKALRWSILQKGMNND